MSLKIGDNFSYLGKKFLDNRQLFLTLNEMNACTDVPNSFVTYCEEDGNRYEFKDGVWKKYVVAGGGSDLNDLVHWGVEEPTNEDSFWFDSTHDQQLDITLENQLIIELQDIIKQMHNQITILQADVEYLKLHGGGSSSGGNNGNKGNRIVLETGGALLLETGGALLLEN